MENVINEIKSNLNNKKVLVACSTGVDSMTLLSVINNTIPKNNIIVAHVNHKRREQSEIEEAYLKEYCQKENLLLEVKELDKTYQGNFQEWAREMRYNFFKEVAIKYHVDVILLAHHADDNIETILMRLIKTSSLKGYSGIAKWSKLDDIDIYRPFIDIPKIKIKDYAKEQNIKYFEDESNAHDDYTRNRIRHNVIPFFLEENPNLYVAIKNYSETLRSANKLLEKVKVEFIENKVSVNNNGSDVLISFALKDFLELDDDFKVHVLFRILKQFSLSRLCIEDIIKQIKAPKNTIITSINNNLSMIKEYGSIIFTNREINKLSFFLKIDKEGLYILPNNQELKVEKKICYFKATSQQLWYNIDNFPIYVRSRMDGDKITLKLGNKSISDILTNKKIPYLQRKDTLLLCDESKNIIGILGIVLK